MDAHTFQQYAEAYMDSAGLANVLAEIAEVCVAKGDHVQTNWQDDALAERWRLAAQQLHNLCYNIDDPMGSAS